VYSFKLHEVRSVHDVMGEVYDRWVAKAPRGWFKNNFFRDSRPIIISCVYGQNQPICPADVDSYRVERRAWREERDYSKIKYLSLAIASHTRFMHLLASLWQSLTVQPSEPL
jgi:hypothetical protein